MGKQKADYLLRSDHIFTSTVENPFAGYVAVNGQNILAVGTDDGVIGLTNRQRFWNWEISW